MAKLLATTVTGIMNVSSTTNSANYVTTAGLDVMAVANAAQNSVATFANGTIVLNKANLNFNNTATINVSAVANGTGQVNVSFTANVTGGAGSPGGSNTFIQYNSDGGFGGTANLSFNISSNVTFMYRAEIDTTVRFNEQASTPSAPPAGNVSIFGRSVGGRIMPAFIGPSGVDTPVQPHMGRNRVAFIQWTGTGAFANVHIGFPGAPTYVGTVTARTISAASFFASVKRLGFLSAATAGANAHARFTTAQYLRGNTAGMGGFHAIHRFGVSDAATVAGAGMFLGFTATTGQIANSANVVTLANTCGVGQIPTSNNLHIVTNRSQAAGYVVDTGLACNVGNTYIYDVSIFTPPNENDVKFVITNIANTAQTFSTTITANSTNLPMGNTLLTWQSWRSNGGAASAVGLDLVSLYIETDS